MPVFKVWKIFWKDSELSLKMIKLLLSYLFILNVSKLKKLNLTSVSLKWSQHDSFKNRATLHIYLKKKHIFLQHQKKFVFFSSATSFNTFCWEKLFVNVVFPLRFWEFKRQLMIELFMSVKYSCILSLCVWFFLLPVGFLVFQSVLPACFPVLTQFPLSRCFPFPWWLLTVCVLFFTPNQCVASVWLSHYSLFVSLLIAFSWVARPVLSPELQMFCFFIPCMSCSIRLSRLLGLK